MTGAIIVGGVLTLIAYAWRIEPYWLRFQRRTIRPERVRSGARVRLLHVTDLHFKRMSRRERSLLRHVRGQPVDATVITGDTVERGCDLEQLVHFLNQLPPPVIIVWGNLERWAKWDLTALRSLIERRTAARILINQTVVVRGAHGVIAVTGVDDPHYGFDDLPASGYGQHDADLRVLLAHSPDIMTRLPEAQFDLALCGHTHGGQLRIPGVKPLYLATNHPVPVEPLFRSRQTWFHVSRGVGVAVLPCRFACRPDVTVLNLHGQAS